MSYTDLTEVRRNWPKLAAGERDAVLANLGFMMAGDSIRVLTLQQYPPSLYKAIAPVLANTRACRWAVAGTILMWAAIALAVALWFSERSWMQIVALSVGLIWGAVKADKYLYRRAIASAAAESPDSFVELWNLEAFAAKIKGAIYLPQRNRWQDVVLLAAGWADLVGQVPVAEQVQ